MRSRLALTAIASTVLALTSGTAVSVAAAAPADAAPFPKVISLPKGFRPEGIATGRGTHFYVGSQVDGAIYRGDLLTGRGAVFVPGTAGDTVRGLKVSDGRLFAAGGPSGTVKVYDVRTGRLLLRSQAGRPAPASSTMWSSPATPPTTPIPPRRSCTSCRSGLAAGSGLCGRFR